LFVLKTKKTCHPEGRALCGPKDLNLDAVQNPKVEILRLLSSGSLRKTLRAGCYGAIAIPQGSAGILPASVLLFRRTAPQSPVNQLSTFLRATLRPALCSLLSSKTVITRRFLNRKQERA